MTGGARRPLAPAPTLGFEEGRLEDELAYLDVVLGAWADAGLVRLPAARDTPAPPRQAQMPLREMPPCLS